MKIEDIINIPEILDLFIKNNKIELIDSNYKEDEINAIEKLFEHFGEKYIPKIIEILYLIIPKSIVIKILLLKYISYQNFVEICLQKK